MPRKRKRRYGEGTVYRTAHGWGGQVVIDGKRVGRRGATREEVERKLDTLLMKHTAGEPTTALTVADIVAGFVEYHCPRVAEATADQTRHVARHVIRILGDEPAAELTTGRIEDALAAKLATGLSANYVGRMRSLLARSYRWAIRRRLLDANPAAATETVRGSSAPLKEPDPLTVPELRALLDVARHDRVGVAVWLGALAGLQVAEIRGLLVSDIDLDAKVIRVTGQADTAGRRRAVKGGATSQRRRAVRMSDELCAVVAEHIERRGLEWANIGHLWPDENRDRLIVTEAGTPIEAGNLLKRVKRWAAAAGIERNVTTAQMRQTFGSLALASGRATIKDVAQMLGHSDSRTAEMHYVRHLDDVYDRASIVGDLVAARQDG